MLAQDPVVKMAHDPMALLAISKMAFNLAIGSPNEVSHHDMKSIAIQGQSKVTNLNSSFNLSLSHEVSSSSVGNGILTPISLSSQQSSNRTWCLAPLSLALAWSWWGSQLLFKGQNNVLKNPM